MIRIFYILIINSFLIYNSYLVAAASISKIDGSVVHGQVVTILGMGFKKKTFSEPLKWETFDDGILGNSIEESGYWSARTRSKAIYSNTNKRYKQSGNNISVIQDVINNYKEWFYRNNIGFKSSGKAYINFWVYLDYVRGDDSWQLKVWRINSDGNDHGSRPAVMHQSWAASANPTSARHYLSVVNNTKSMSLSFDDPIPEKYWLNISVEFQESDLNVENGSLKYCYSSPIDQDKAYITKVLGNIVTKDSESDIDAIALGYLIENGGLYAESVWDDIYLDNSWARVEIGDKETYTGCTHREIQLPKRWGRIQLPHKEEIEVQLNQGALPSGVPVYLFVVNEEGEVSDQDLTIEGSQGYLVQFQ